MSGRPLSAEKRAAVEQLLREGLSNKVIARRVDCHHATVGRIRKALGLPNCKPGRKTYPSLAEAFRGRTEWVADGGHLRWTGGFHEEGMPTFMHAGEKFSAYRIAFKLRTRRNPIGQAKPGCDFANCVEPTHVRDQRERDRDRDAYKAIFRGDA